MLKFMPATVVVLLLQRIKVKTPLIPNHAPPFKEDIFKKRLDISLTLYLEYVTFYTFFL
jgi:hypothetical protein